LKEIPIDGIAKRETEEFEKEVNVLSTLSKPTREIPTHLVRFLGCQRTEESLQLFMSLYEGNLNQVLCNLKGLKIPKFLEETRLARYVTQLLKGLNILHHRNIIHRDIKSPNIFYTALERWDGTPRIDSPRNGLLPESLVLGDFGEAKILHPYSKAKTCRGTPSWIAPEVLDAAMDDNLEYTLAADIWSMGMVVYEMMTLTQPYSDVAALRVMYCVQEGILPTLAEDFYRWYPRVSRVWHRMLKRDPDERPKVGELLKIFQDIAANPIPFDDPPSQRAEFEEEEDDEWESSDVEEESTASEQDSSSQPIFFDSYGK
jgi:serine/threonine protein kinase